MIDHLPSLQSEDNGHLPYSKVRSVAYLQEQQQQQQQQQQNQQQQRHFDDRLLSKLALTQSKISNSTTNSIDSESIADDSNYITASTNVQDSDLLIEDNASTIKWIKLKQLSTQVYSREFKLTYGSITCMAVSDSNIYFGTTKGYITIFDYSQNLVYAIGKDHPVSITLGSITCLTISLDSKYIACGYSTGDIIIWSLSNFTQPLHHIKPISLNDLKNLCLDHHKKYSSSINLADFLKKKGYHLKGIPIKNLTFINKNYKLLISNDNLGIIIYHEIIKTLLTGHFKSTVILGINQVINILNNKKLIDYNDNSSMSQLSSSTTTTTNSQSSTDSVLTFSLLPVITISKMKELGILAIMTNKVMIVISLFPNTQTHFKVGKPKIINDSLEDTNCLAWFPSISLNKNNTNSNNNSNSIKSDMTLPVLAYCWSNVLTIFDVDTEIIEDNSGEKSTILKFENKRRWVYQESFINIQWLNNKVLALLTTSQRLIFLNRNTLRIISSIDLLSKHIQNKLINLNDLDINNDNSIINQGEPNHYSLDYNNFIRFYRGKLFLFGKYEFHLGSITNWADKLLDLLKAGHYIETLELSRNLYDGNCDLLLLGLPESNKERHDLMFNHIIDLLEASLNYIFNDNSINNLTEVERNLVYSNFLNIFFKTCITINCSINLYEILFEKFNLYELKSLYFETLETFITNGAVKILPPLVLKEMVKYYIDLNNGLILEQLLCQLDIKQLDIDLTIQLCETNHLQDTYVYIWNTLMLDYISPIFDAIKTIKQIVYNNNNNNNLTDDELKVLKNDSYYIYPYISYILTNRQFPTDKLIDPSFEISSKLNIYYILFNGNSISWPKNSEKLHIMDEDYELNEPAFPYLFLLLKYDSCQMFACLNEAFEDDLMNDDEINYYSNGSGNSGSYSASASASASTSSPSSSSASSSWNTNGYELKVSRQYIIEILLGIFNENYDDFTPNDKTYLAIFIARNYPKYNQFLRLSDYILDDIIDKLCKYSDPNLKDDCELSLQSLLSIYKPTHIDTMIPIFEKVGFYNALLSIYRSENKVLDLLELWLKTKQDTKGKKHGAVKDTENNSDKDFLSDFKIEELFNSIPEMIEACILSVDDFYKIELENLFKDNLEIFINTNPIEICKIFNKYLPSISIEILNLQDSLNKYYYIKELIDLEKQSALSFPLSKDIKFEYIKLLNEYEKSKMKGYILSLDESLIDFEKLIYFLKQNRLRNIVYEIYKKDRKYEEALGEVIAELNSIADELIEKLDSDENTAEKDAKLLNNNNDDYYKDIELKLWDYLIMGFDVCEEYQKFERSNIHNGTSKKNKKELTKSESMLLLITETNVKLFIRVNRRLIDNINNEPELLTDEKDKTEVEAQNVNDTADKLIDNDIKLTLTQSKIIGLIKRLVQDSFYNLINLQGKLSPILNFQDSQSILDSIKRKNGNNDSFLRIFSEFLNRSSSKVTTLGDVRSILNEIFLAYSYEENILGLSLKLLNEDIYKEIEFLESKEYAGWSLNNLECEICGKKIWGSHINNKIFELWQDANFTGIKSNSETKDFEIVVFRCRHGYHTKCLHGMGVSKDNLLCVLCRSDS